MKRLLIYGSVWMLCGSLYSQGLPNIVFPTLQFNPSARLAGLGTNFASLPEQDISMAISNASLLSNELHNTAMLNYADYFSAYSSVNAAYARDLKTIGVFLASMQYVNYGDVETYDAEGNYLGRSNRLYDVALNVGWGKALDSSFRIGANFKYLHSRLTQSHLNGVAVDLSASYIRAQAKDPWAVSVAFRNIGTVLQQNIVRDYETLPFEIDLGFYIRASHAPFAGSVVLTNLQKWNLSGVDVNAPTINSVTGDTTSVNKFSTFTDNALRHVNLGVEFIPFKWFTFRLGYNYQRRKEMATSERPGFVGFSWGIGLKIYNFQVDYARAAYHLAGAPNYISISTNLNNFNL
ncbi:MAG: type IX secretion system protein PorQ [Bacteroidales bacterium]|jgi:hypothetical protein|nr:type IX secretion system protein PorQ [Bacteroidales bacterium]